MTEINTAFKYFLLENGVVSSPLPTDEVVDMLEFGCPPTWQKEMILQDFDATTATVSEFVDFFERLELVENLSKEPSRNHKEPPEERKRPAKKSRHGE